MLKNSLFFGFLSPWQTRQIGIFTANLQISRLHKSGISQSVSYLEISLLSILETNFCNFWLNFAHKLWGWPFRVCLVGFLARNRCGFWWVSPRFDWEFWREFEDFFFLFSVGLDAAGKTTILYKLKLGEIVTTIPTIGKFRSWSLMTSDCGSGFLNNVKCHRHCSCHR